MPSIKETIASLDALREKATQGEYANRDNRALLVLNDSLPGNCKQIAAEVHKDDIQYIATLHNSYETLRNAALAGEKLANEVGYSLQDEREQSTQEILLNALSAYRTACGEGKKEV